MLMWAGAAAAWEVAGRIPLDVKTCSLICFPSPKDFVVRHQRPWFASDGLARQMNAVTGLLKQALLESAALRRPPFINLNQ